MRRNLLINISMTTILFLVIACGKEDVIIEPEPLTRDCLIEVFGLKVGEAVYLPVDTTAGYCIICVSKDVDITRMTPIFRIDSQDTLKVNNVIIESNKAELDFSDVHNGLVLKVTSSDFKSKENRVKVVNTDIPVVSVNTPEACVISDKEHWIGDANIIIWEPERGVVYNDTTNIKGRGNYTWTYPKKPYALKLNRKEELLGLTKHKRFCLLACWKGLIGNYYMAEVAKRCTGNPWVPQGKFVEFVLNGNFQGLYYLSEQIKVDKNRVNIKELKSSDVGGAEITGGYLLELDEEFDEDYKFRSEIYQMPVMLKSPDENVPQEQLDFIKGFVNSMELELSKIGSEKSNYQDYLDINSFADYWMASEVIYCYEVKKPRSFYMYKGRDGIDSTPGSICKMKAGPFRDQEWVYVEHWWNNKDAHYFGALFKDDDYRTTVKNRWKQFRDNLEGRGAYPHVIESINSIYKKISYSAHRDSVFWQNDAQLYHDVKILNEGFTSKLDWMEEFINTLE